MNGLKTFDDLVVSKINQGDYKSLTKLWKNKQIHKNGSTYTWAFFTTFICTWTTNKKWKSTIFCGKDFKRVHFSMRSVYLVEIINK